MELQTGRDPPTPQTPLYKQNYVDLISIKLSPNPEFSSKFNVCVRAEAENNPLQSDPVFLVLAGSVLLLQTITVQINSFSSFCERVNRVKFVVNCPQKIDLPTSSDTCRWVGSYQSWRAPWPSASPPPRGSASSPGI